MAEKFRLCAEYAGFPGERTDGVIETVARLEALADLRELTTLLANPAPERAAR